MQLFKGAAISAVVFAGLASAQDSFSVATPSSLVQCQPYLITWTGGTAPFYPRITQPRETSQIIENFPETSDRTYSWIVDQPVGQTVTIVVVDSTGANAPSSVSPSVAAGSSSACLNSSSSSSGASSTGSASSSSAPTSSSSSSSSSSAASSSALTSSSGSSTGTASSSSAAASSTSSSTPDSASTLRGFAAVVAGTVGVVVAALV